MNYQEIKARALRTWGEFESRERTRILVGAGTCGCAAGAKPVIESIKQKLNGCGIQADVHEVGCLGMCYAETMIEVSKPNFPRILYGNISPQNVDAFAEECFFQNHISRKFALAITSGESHGDLPRFEDLPMIQNQVRVALRNCGWIDPKNIDHYIGRGGYAGLEKALSMGPAAVIGEIKKSGLRGRGGAGFPTFRKWELCAASAGNDKYMICNADEGDPGAFMDRSVLESDPHAVLEGMVIGAFAIGARHGYVYVRAEYPLAVKQLESGIQAMHAHGLLGKNILGSGFDFEIIIKEGAGAFVCGEETALIASIEGKRGMPSQRPPYPAVSGLFGKPTNINNVETLANVSAILSHGGEWYAQYGTEKSKGTKTFALAGKINRTGLIEVPLGISLKEIVYEIGGGIPNNKKLKAVQTGGPSGGCLPASAIDLPVDYEHLSEAGSIMGSGGMIVMDEDTCAVDISKYFLDFTKQESCGKCTPCRVGTAELLVLLQKIASGNAKESDLDLLTELGTTIKAASLCGLGQTAPNPVLTTLRYFRGEYEEHIREKKCRAGQCVALIRFEINDACTGCMACKKACPVKAVSGERKKRHSISQNLCIKCGLCYGACKFNAINRF